MRDTELYRAAPADGIAAARLWEAAQQSPHSSDPRAVVMRPPFDTCS